MNFLIGLFKFFGPLVIAVTLILGPWFWWGMRHDDDTKKGVEKRRLSEQLERARDKELAARRKVFSETAPIIAVIDGDKNGVTVAAGALSDKK